MLEASVCALLSRLTGKTEAGDCVEENTRTWETDGYWGWILGSPARPTDSDIHNATTTIQQQHVKWNMEESRKCRRKKPLERPGYRWKDNIKMNLKEI